MRRVALADGQQDLFAPQASAEAWVTHLACGHDAPARRDNGDPYGKLDPGAWISCRLCQTQRRVVSVEPEPTYPCCVHCADYGRPHPPHRVHCCERGCPGHDLAVIQTGDTNAS